MFGDENNPEPIEARLRRPLEPLGINADADEPMDLGRPLAPLAPLAPIAVVPPLVAGVPVPEVDSEMDGTVPPQAQLPAKRKDSDIKSAYQLEEEEDQKENLSMSDPYKGKGFLRLEIERWSDFSRSMEPDKQQRISKAVWVRGLPWKILAIPRSIDRGVHRHQKALGFFLQCNAQDAGESGNWNCVAHAELKLYNKKPGGSHYSRRITHTFYPKENDWGYSTFLTVDQINDPPGGEIYVENDTVSLGVHFSAEAPHGVSWDSRKHTGFVGLKNQGATCYMNSIFQTFFFTNSLRKAVYQMQMSPDEDPESSVALAMQRVFYDLSHSDKPVGTKKLTKSFGWDSIDSFLQHDVQELCRVLLDNLETKMKGTPVQDMIPTLFKGKMCSYIKCTDVDYESAREEIFYDVQLNIRSRDPSRTNASFSIIDSFRDYVEPERLDGDNKYDAGQYGLQPALKGVRFVSFPPILQFQLMRFQFDPNLESNVKVNDRFEFSDLINLNEFIEKNEEGIDYTYLLHAVLVHSGDFHGGHYVVYINTDVKGQTAHWCKFDDDVVSRSTFKDACVANYGGDDSEEVLGRIYTNAYMLVYIRKDKLDEVLCDVTDADIPRDLIERFEADKIEEEKMKKEKREAHLYQSIFFLTDDILDKHHGFDCFDVKSLDTPEIHRKLEKNQPISKLFQYVHDNFLGGENVTDGSMSFRLWRFNEALAKEDNRTVLSLPRWRATDTIPLNHENMNRALTQMIPFDKTIIYVEKPRVRPDGTIALPEFSETADVLVFLKYYDHEAKEIRYLGTIIIHFSETLLDASREILGRLGLPSDTKLRFYEELSPECIRILDSPGAQLGSGKLLHEMMDGTIIIFERIEFTTMLDNAKTFMEKKYNTIDIEIIHNDEANSFPPSDEEPPQIQGKADLGWRCDRLAEHVAQQLNLDPAYLMLWRLAPYSEKPNQPVSPQQLIHSNFRVKELLSLTTDIIHDPRKNKRYKIYYNKIPVPVAELERRRQMKVQLVDEKFNTYDVTIFPDKFGHVRDVLIEARKSFASLFSPSGTGKLRLLLVGLTPSNKRCLNLFSEDESISVLFKQSPQAYGLRVEEVPPDQLTKGPHDILMPIAHYDKNPQERMFGVPFYLKVTEGESFHSVRERIRIRLDLTEKEIEKYKFAILAGQRTIRTLDMDSDERVRIQDLTVFPRGAPMDNRAVTSTQVWLGLDHFNRTRGTEKLRAEKAIVIHN